MNSLNTYWQLIKWSSIQQYFAEYCGFSTQFQGLKKIIYPCNLYYNRLCKLFENINSKKIWQEKIHPYLCTPQVKKALIFEDRITKNNVEIS
jgi:hypothetical protein